jgi:hypothetical protein
MLVDKVGQPLRIANRRRGTKKSKKSQCSLQNQPATDVVGRTRRCRGSLFKG